VTTGGVRCEEAGDFIVLNTQTKSEGTILEGEMHGRAQDFTEKRLRRKY
jgi:hypothetical protein